MSTDMNTRVEQYIKLRDHIKSITEKHEAELAPFKDLLERMNAAMLQRLNDLGGDSLKTEKGTVYRTERKAASIADADAFMDFVVANNAWDLLDRKANKTAVEDFIKNHDTPPPGVNFTKTFVVGVRRS